MLYAEAKISQQFQRQRNIQECCQTKKEKRLLTKNSWINFASSIKRISFKNVVYNENLHITSNMPQIHYKSAIPYDLFQQQN